MDVINVSKLNKTYPGFALKDVSFNLEEGRIMGFIGRNGAGKTTTLKSLLNFVHPDSGDVSFFGKTFDENELEIKENIGYVAGGFDYYSKKKLSSITGVTKKFYKNWDEETYQELMRKFSLDETKTPAKLSAGMKVKYSIALALSHKARVLILDEPTSGIDPISRDELIDVFSELQKKGVAILFSTHVTSDLDKCADDITYIRKGEILASLPLEDFYKRYALLQCESSEGLPETIREKMIGFKREKRNCSALLLTEDLKQLEREVNEGLEGIKITDNLDLETIMIHLEREKQEEEEAL